MNKIFFSVVDVRFLLSYSFPFKNSIFSSFPFKKRSRNHTTIHLRLSLLLLLLPLFTAPVLLTSSLFASVPHPPPGELSESVLSVVALSPCLSYITGAPNSPPPAPSVVCCGTFFQIVVTAGPTCVCYLVQDPLILGFPIDTTQLVALFPSCGANNTTSAIRWLYDTCRGGGGLTIGPSRSSVQGKEKRGFAIARTSSVPLSQQRFTSSSLEEGIDRKWWFGS